MKKIIILVLILLPLSLLAQDVKLNEGIKLFEKTKYNEAKKIFEEILNTDSTNHKTLYYLGRLEYNNQNVDEAINYFETAIKLDNKSDYYLWTGVAFLSKIQNASQFEIGVFAGKMFDNLNKAIEINPANVTARSYLAGYYLNAPSIAGGSIKKARAEVEEIKKYSPEQALILIAQIYENEGENDKAIAEYLKYLEQDPGNKEIYYSLGMLYQKMEKFEKAFNTFETSLKINKEDYASLYQIGRTAVFSGKNIDRGIECLKLYLQMNNDSSLPAKDAAHWRLGALYEHLGDSNSAKEEYNKAAKINPGEKKYLEALKKL